MSSRSVLVRFVTLFAVLASACSVDPDTEASRSDGGRSDASASETAEPASDFEVTADPRSVTLAAGSSSTITVEISRVGSAGRSIQLIAGNLPTGVTAKAATVAAGASTATISLTAASTAAGVTRTITVTGSDGLHDRTASVSLTVIPRSESVPGALARISLSPNPAMLAVGATVQLTATMFDSSGAVLTGKSLFWQSASGAVANISSSGLVEGIGVGTTTVTAGVDGVSATVQVQVIDKAGGGATDAVATITVWSATSVDLRVGQSQQLLASVRSSAGTVLTGRTVTWSTSAPGVATVSATGLVTGVAVGMVRITATCEGKTGWIDAPVNADVSLLYRIEMDANNYYSFGYDIGTPVTLWARVWVGSSSQMVPNAQLTWTSSNPAVATVDPMGMQGGAGIYVKMTPLSGGETTITAKVGVAMATQVIKVRFPPQLASVRILPSAFNVQLGKTVTPQLELLDTEGFTFPRAVACTYSFANTTIATVSSALVVTGRALGSTTLTASCEGKSATAQVTVVAPTEDVYSLTVTPASSSLAIGGTQQLTATLKGLSGAVLTGRIVTWSSSSASVATVSTSGLVTAIGAGNATITATSEGKSGTAQVTVTSAGGGGGGGGTTCTTTMSLGPLQPGTATAWATAPVKGGVTVQVSMGTFNTGSAASPSYEYHLSLKNTSTQRIDVSWAFKVGGTAPTSTTSRTDISAGSTSTDYTYGAPGQTIWLRLNIITIGTTACQ